MMKSAMKNLLVIAAFIAALWALSMLGILHEAPPLISK
jgi:hypothetical protein